MIKKICKEISPSTSVSTRFLRFPQDPPSTFPPSRRQRLWRAQQGRRLWEVTSSQSFIHIHQIISPSDFPEGSSSVSRGARRSFTRSLGERSRRVVNPIKISLLLTFLLTFPLYPITIGSDKEVNVFSTQQVLNDGDRVARFAALENGFRINGILSMVTFDSFFPVLGDVEFDGSTLILNHDLVLQDNGALLVLGNIQGNKHKIDIQADVAQIPKTEPDALECKLFFILRQVESFDINSVDWSDDDQYILVGLDANGTAVAKIYRFNGSSLEFQDGVALDGQQVNVVRWHPTENYVAIGTVNNGAGAELYIYSFDPGTGMLTFSDSVEVGADVQAMSWHQAAGSYLAIGTNAATDEVRIYSFNTGTGALSASPVDTIDLSPSRIVQSRAMDWDSFGSTYLAFGVDATGGGDTLLVYEFNTGTETFSLNASINTERSVTALEWNPLVPNILGIGLQGASGELLQVYEHDGGGNMLTQIAGISDIPGMVRNLDWSRLTGACMGIINDNDFAGQLRTYFFDESDNSLSLIFSNDFSDPAKAIRWSHNGRWVVAGHDSEHLDIHESAKDYFDNNFVNFTDLKLFFNNDTLINNIFINIRGECSLVGRGTTLTLGPDVQIRVDQNSSLLVKDLIFKGINGTKLNAVDATSTYTFQNARIVLDNNFTFTQGRFDIRDSCIIEGENFTFTYQSPGESKILSRSNLTLLNNIIFDYCPTNNSATLLTFANNTSRLTLDGATLKTTNTGLVLQGGSIYIQNESIFDTNESGITFGDEVNVLNDCIVLLKNASTLVLRNGTIIYKNLLSSSLQFNDHSSHLNCLSGTRLNILQSMVLNNGIVVFENNATFARRLTADIIGSIHSLGEIINEVL